MPVHVAVLSLFYFRGAILELGIVLSNGTQTAIEPLLSLPCASRFEENNLTLKLPFGTPVWVDLVGDFERVAKDAWVVEQASRNLSC